MNQKTIVTIGPGIRLITLRGIGKQSRDINDYISITSQQDQMIDGEEKRIFVIGVEAHNPSTTTMWNIDKEEEVEVQMPTVNDYVTDRQITYHLATTKNRLNDGDTNSTYVQVLGKTTH